MPDADWWAKVARDRPGGEGMTDVPTLGAPCPVCGQRIDAIKTDFIKGGMTIHHHGVLARAEGLAGSSTCVWTPPPTADPKPLTDEELTDIETKAGRFADAHEPALLLFARTCIDLVAEVRRLRDENRDLLGQIRAEFGTSDDPPKQR